MILNNRLVTYVAISILVMVLPMKSFTGNLALIKFLQDGFQNKSQKNTNASVSQFAEAY